MGPRRKSAPTIKLAETELAAYVIKHLKDNGWEIYQEVQVRSLGAIADIVAVKEGEVMVVETKTTFGLTVLAQAWAWKNLAHYSVVAVPRARNHTKARSFGQQVAWKFGIGVFTVQAKSGNVYTQITPAKNPSAQADKILNILTEQHKTYAKAGSSDGKHLTPFKMTCQQLTKLVKERPGISLQEAVKKIDHHYAHYKSAVSSLGKQIVRFDRVPNVYAEWDGKRKVHRLYYRAQQTSPFPPRRKSIEASAASDI